MKCSIFFRNNSLLTLCKTSSALIYQFELPLPATNPLIFFQMTPLTEKYHEIVLIQETTAVLTTTFSLSCYSFFSIFLRCWWPTIYNIKDFRDYEVILTEQYFLNANVFIHVAFTEFFGTSSASEFWLPKLHFRMTAHESIEPFISRHFSLFIEVVSRAVFSAIWNSCSFPNISNNNS
jgi:hypothetical protein